MSDERDASCASFTASVWFSINIDAASKDGNNMSADTAEEGVISHCKGAECKPASPDCGTNGSGLGNPPAKL
jgi:hypothetical protein